LARNSCNKPYSARPTNLCRSLYGTAPVAAGQPSPASPNPEPSRPTGASPTGKSPPPLATTAARLFFPQSKSLSIDRGSTSPTLLKKIVYAGSNGPAFKRGSIDLRVLAEVSVDPKRVERLTEQIGQERLAERDALVAAYLERPLAQREDPPAGVTAPQLAVVEMDGGRLQIRKPDEQSREPEPVAPEVGNPSVQEPLKPTTPPGTDEASVATATPSGSDEAPEHVAKSKHWREDKVGCLLVMKSEVRDVDPCPEIPAVFVDPLQSLKLAQQIGQCAVPQGTPFRVAQPEDDEATDAEQRDEPSKRPGRPEVEKKRVVASRKDVHHFGPLLAATACAMGLYAAARRAFVADGLSENWSIYKRYFARWTAVLDFVHALTYVYAAAMAGRIFAEGWPVYERWIRWVWAGLANHVIEELRARQQEVGRATKEDKEGSPRRVVQDALTYLSNHKDKMRYDEYRKAGLPLMSSHVESTVKQINYRVKGTEKFWTEEGAEAILQLRADYLSDDEPMEDFWQRRQDAATGQRRYRSRCSA
jgi:hypothetical protein